LVSFLLINVAAVVRDCAVGGLPVVQVGHRAGFLLLAQLEGVQTDALEMLHTLLVLCLIVNSAIVTLANIDLRNQLRILILYSCVLVLPLLRDQTAPLLLLFGT
jgi:hypothetical protein